MTTPGQLADGRTADYAGGLWVTTYKGLPMLEHGGGGDGFRTELMHFPDQRLSIITLCNAGRATSARRLALGVADVYLAQQLAQPISQGASETLADDEAYVHLSDKELGRFVGQYIWFENGYILLDIRKEGENLVLDYSGRGEFELAPLSPARFRILNFGLASGPRYLSFEVDATEATRSLSYEGMKGLSRKFHVVRPPSTVKKLDVAGRYRSEELNATYNAFFQDGSLIIRLVEPAARSIFPEPLLHLGDDHYATGGYTSFEFIRSALGKVSGMNLRTDREIMMSFRRLNDRRME